MSTTQLIKRLFTVKEYHHMIEAGILTKNDKVELALLSLSMNSRNNLCNASECKSTHIRKNGKKKGKQNHICVQCGRQFINEYEPQRGDSETIKRDGPKNVRQWYGFTGDRTS